MTEPDPTAGPWRLVATVATADAYEELKALIVGEGGTVHEAGVDLADVEPRGLEAIRAGVRRDLDAYAETGGRWLHEDVVDVALLTRALVELERLAGGDDVAGLLIAKLEGELEAREEVHNALAAAVDNLLAAAEDLTADDFPPRVDAVVGPLRELEDLRQKGER